MTATITAVKGTRSMANMTRQAFWWLALPIGSLLVVAGAAIFMVGTSNLHTSMPLAIGCLVAYTITFCLGVMCCTLPFDFRNGHASRVHLWLYWSSLGILAAHVAGWAAYALSWL